MMKKLLVSAVAVTALAIAAAAGAALTPWTFNGPGVNCPVVSTFNGGVLHLEKNCTTSTNASAGATIGGLSGQMFQSASFTLASTSQCQGGSPRFNVFTTGGTFFLGCNNVTPTINSDGTATYSFTAADLQPAVAGTTPGTITSSQMQILIDQQGTADITKIVVNGVQEVPTPTAPTSKNACKHGGWKHFSSPSFKNQGQCVSYWNHALHAAKHHK
jgi:hypothetical protein